MDLKDLQKPLSIDDIEFRVGSTSVKTKKVSLLAYKNARVDMNRLDAVCGLDGWENTYDRDSKGVLQCGIGIYSDKRERFIWKWSNGVESYTEAQKGEYSDAFKRAGFMWGIGRELYQSPDMWIKLKDKEYYIKGDKLKTTGWFRPNDWQWTFDIQKGKFKAVDGSNVRFQLSDGSDDKIWLDETKKKHWKNAEQKMIGREIKPHELREYYKVSNANMDYFESIYEKQKLPNV